MSEQRQEETKTAARQRPISFGLAFLVIAALSLAANIVQIFADRWLDAQLRGDRFEALLDATSRLLEWAGLRETFSDLPAVVRHYMDGVEAFWMSITIAAAAVAFLVAGVVGIVHRVRTVKLFASLRFAASVVAVLALATIVGTLILQGLPPEAFEERYGDWTGFLLALQLDDVFHSFWYLGILGLSAVALTVDAVLRIQAIAQGKRKSWANAGFIGTHVGIVLVLAGGLLSLLGGQKGMVHLHAPLETLSPEIRESALRFRNRYFPGWRSSRNVFRQTARVPEEERSGKLPFTVRLDAFDVERYADEFSLYLYELLPGVGENGRRNIRVIGALKSEAGDRHFFGGGYEISVVGVSGPQAAPAPERATAPHKVVIDGKREAALRLGETVALGDGTTLKALRFLPHFNYDINSRQAVSVSDRPENPALEILVTRDADGEVVYRGWLFVKHPGFSMEGHGSDVTRRLVYHYSGGAGGGGGAGARTIELRLRRDGAEVTARLPEQSGDCLPFFDHGRLCRGQVIPEFRLAVGDSGRIPVEGGEYAVAYSVKGDRIKQYHSTISLLKDGREIVSRQPLSVNHPIWQDGWALYQSNFDPRDPGYSGIQVVADPGLFLVYLGLAVMGLGVIHILYLRSWRPGRRRKKEGDAAPPGDDAGILVAEGGGA